MRLSLLAAPLFLALGTATGGCSGLGPPCDGPPPLASRDQIARAYAGTPVEAVSPEGVDLAGRYSASDGFNSTALTLRPDGTWSSETVHDVGLLRSGRSGQWERRGDQVELVASRNLGDALGTRCDRVRRFDPVRHGGVVWLVDGAARAAVAQALREREGAAPDAGAGFLSPNVFVRASGP